jgi:hypothetical protein
MSLIFKRRPGRPREYPPAPPGITRQAKSIQRIRAQRKSAGLCLCGAAPEPGKSRCRKCLDKIAADMRRYRASR